MIRCTTVDCSKLQFQKASDNILVKVLQNLQFTCKLWRRSEKKGKTGVNYRVEPLHEVAT